jgi:hypothetical protein
LWPSPVELAGRGPGDEDRDEVTAVGAPVGVVVGGADDGRPVGDDGARVGDDVGDADAAGCGFGVTRGAALLVPPCQDSAT